MHGWLLTLPEEMVRADGSRLQYCSYVQDVQVVHRMRVHRMRVRHVEVRHVGVRRMGVGTREGLGYLVIGWLGQNPHSRTWFQKGS